MASTRSSAAGSGESPTQPTRAPVKQRRAVEDDAMRGTVRGVTHLLTSAGGTAASHRNTRGKPGRSGRRSLLVVGSFADLLSAPSSIHAEGGC